MNRLDRYLAKVVSLSILLVLVAVVSLDVIFSLIDELQNLEGDYGASDALLYVLVTIPKRFYEFVSLSVLIGALIGLGTLANNSELTVMRAVGMSLARISWGAIKPALVFVFAALLVGEFVVPHTESYAQSQRALAKSGGKALTTQGNWHREGDTYMHITGVLTGGVLLGITQYQFDGHRLLESRFAKRAIFQGDHWVLQNVQRSKIEADKVTVTQHTTLRWDTELTPDVVNVMVVEPEALSILGLKTYTGYLKQQGLEAKKHLLAFWKKVFQPLATVVMVLVALSCIFGPLRSVTMGYRVFSGVVLGLLFKYTEDFLGPACIVFGFEPIYASLAPIAIFAAAAVVLMRRAA